MFSDTLLIFLACSVLWTTQWPAMEAAGGSSLYYEPDPFTCKCYPDFPDATMSLPRFPFFPLTHGSPPVAMPSAHASDPTKIQSCESQLYNIETCFQDIVNVLLTNKLKIGPACCKSVSMITQGCLNGLIPPFIIDLFGPYIDQLCSAATPLLLFT
ncbi:hypothetical protein V6N13_011227 [Hibiscus sabdariffa]|uniref:Prolamin-like domain-containing protein n=1 Tax=Hibiscus sabdariffa TaxID=183260 RepID=A0ABR2SCI5_9ROSI